MVTRPQKQQYSSAACIDLATDLLQVSSPPLASLHTFPISLNGACMISSSNLLPCYVEHAVFRIRWTFQGPDKSRVLRGLHLPQPGRVPSYTNIGCLFLFMTATGIEFVFRLRLPCDPLQPASLAETGGGSAKPQHPVSHAYTARIATPNAPLQHLNCLLRTEHGQICPYRQPSLNLES